MRHLIRSTSIALSVAVIASLAAATGAPAAVPGAADIAPARLAAIAIDSAIEVDLTW